MRTHTALSVRKICGLIILLVTVAMVMTSCVTPVDQDGSLPWNAPATWEGQNLGVPL